MADTKISGLTSGSAIADTDVFPAVETTGTGPVKKTAAQLKTYAQTNPVGSGTELQYRSSGTAFGAITGSSYGTDANFFSFTTIKFNAATRTQSAIFTDSSDNIEVLFNAANGDVGLALAADVTLSWSDAAGGTTQSAFTFQNTQINTALKRSAAGVINLNGGTLATGGALEMPSYGASPPASPAAATGRIYFDTSGGKVRLMVKFPTGAAQQIAVEP